MTKTFTCNECSNEYSATVEAVRCRNCWDARKAENTTCPQCNGPKAYTAMLCRDCAMTKSVAPLVFPCSVAFKRCSDCGEIKHRNEFHSVASGDDKLRSKCKRCHNAAKYLRVRGWTPERYTVMMYAQGMLCYLCGDPFYGEAAKRDHNHETDEPRALLCHCCNVGLGFFKEDTDRLTAAIRYLEQSVTVSPTREGLEKVLPRTVT